MIRAFAFLTLVNLTIATLRYVGRRRAVRDEHRRKAVAIVQGMLRGERYEVTKPARGSTIEEDQAVLDAVERHLHGERPN